MNWVFFVLGTKENNSLTTSYLADVVQSVKGRRKVGKYVTLVLLVPLDLHQQVHDEIKAEKAKVYPDRLWKRLEAGAEKQTKHQFSGWESVVDQ